MTEPLARPYPQSPTSAPRAENLSILVVDDSVSYRLLLSHPLRKWGYTVYEAADGQQALHLLQEKHIQLVISDWEMPNLNGPQLCAAVRAANLPYYVYFLLLTARQNSEDLIEGMEAGADDFLTKPINPQELRVRLRAGERILNLESRLEERNQHLKQAYQLIENDLKAAAALQHSLLPPSHHRVPNMDCQWFFWPSLFVSGDMHNFFQLDQHHIGFYSVDISGHGVKPAMMSVAINRLLSHGGGHSGLLKKALATPPYYEINSPAEVVNTLNQQFQINSQDSLYFTIVYGIINIQSGEGWLTRAGHPTPMIIYPDGQQRCLDDGELPVGILDDTCYTNQFFSLTAGAQLCLYTDGITECSRADGEQFGEQRLADLLRQCAGLSASQTVERVKHALNQWRGDGASNFEDDVSMLVLTFDPF